MKRIVRLSCLLAIAGIISYILVVFYYHKDAKYVSTKSSYRRLLYDDHYMLKHLDDRLQYLKRVDENNRTMGYVGIRDYFNLSETFWPPEDYFESRNIEQHLYEELKSIAITKGIYFTEDIWSYSDERESVESSGSQRNELECQRDLLYLHKSIKQQLVNNKTSSSSHPLYKPGKKNIDLLRWIDAWGRPTSETHWGKSLWLGSFRGCKYSQVTVDDSEKERRSIKFNYCWAKLSGKDWPDEDVLKPRVSIMSGVCLPASCDTSMARKHKHLIRDLMEFNFPPLQKDRFLSKPIHDLYCLPMEQKFNREAQLFLTGLGVWFALIIVASMSYSKKEDSNTPNGISVDNVKSQLRKCFDCLAIQENWAQLVADNAPHRGSRLDLRAIGIVKFYCSFWVAFGHCVQYMYWYFYTSSIHILEAKTLFYLASAWFVKSVDAFFLASGILTSYTILSKFPKKKLSLIIEPKMYLLINLARYLRVAPVLIFGFAFVKALFVYLSDGPFWDYGTYKYSYQGMCRSISWWRLLIWPIIFDVQAKGGDPYQCECLYSSWYIVTDIKMFLFVPFYLYALQKYKRKRLWVLSSTIFVTLIWGYMQMSLQNVVYYGQSHYYGMIHFSSLLIAYFETSYYSAVNRFCPLAIGLFAGIHLYRYKQGKIRQWPWWMRGWAVWFCIMWQIYDLLLRPMLSELHYRQTGQIPSEESIKWTTLLIQRWDIITIAIFALRLATDCSGGLMRNASFCFKLSKLSYGVYIIHMILARYAIQATEHARPDSSVLHFSLFTSFIITISFALALPMYLFIESPLALLLNQASGRAKFLDEVTSSTSLPTPSIKTTASSSSLVEEEELQQQQQQQHKGTANTFDGKKVTPFKVNSNKNK